MRTALTWAALAWAALATCVIASAQQPRTLQPRVIAPRADKAPGAALNAPWKFDTIQLKDGREFQGLLRSKTATEVKFVEVSRQPGKQLYLVVMSFDPRSVAKTELLATTDRKLLLQRIGELLTKKSKARVEAARMEDINLRKLVDDGVPRYVYEHAWFTLESTADEESTRRCAVRIEQVFRAFSLILPPRTNGRGDLEVLLFGAMDEYRRHAEARGLPIDNPAFYSADDNQIVAGSELARYSEQLAQIRAQNEELRKRYEEANRQFGLRLVKRKEEMKEAKFPPGDIENELKLLSAAWDREYKQMVGADGDSGRLARVDRRNEARFQDLTDQMFHRLYHEAFHAYLENYVFPAGQSNVPRWLNEGLAQIFEKGQLESDSLRIDAPDRDTLLALQADLTSANPLSLEQVLIADERSFLVTHGDAHASKRYYLYSWGLAWDLALELDPHLLASDRFADYVAADGPARSPVTRFEKLVGMPLPDYEQQWRTRMLEKK